MLASANTSTNQPQVYLRVFPPEPHSHPPRHPTPLDCHRTLGRAPCLPQRILLLSILHMVMYMLPRYSLNLSHSLLPAWCPQVCSIFLHLHCFSELVVAVQGVQDSLPSATLLMTAPLWIYEQIFRKTLGMCKCAGGARLLFLHLA